MGYSVGDLYKVRITFENSTQFKSSPAIIVDIPNNAEVLIVFTTSSPPKKPSGYYDQYKFKILKWQKAGLAKPSYARIDRPIVVHNSALFQHIGELDNSDLQHLAEMII